MVKITKKVDIMKKFRFFQKVKVMIGTVTKYELLTPRELEDIQNLAKTFFLLQKKKFFVNSLIFIFNAYSLVVLMYYAESPLPPPL